MHLVHNEQAKLTAAYLNGLAITVFAIGGLGPMISYAFGDAGKSLWTIAIVAVLCFAGSLALHFLARNRLKGMRE
jgi:hypothetical protein